MKPPFDKITSHFFGSPEDRWNAAGAEYYEQTVNQQTRKIPLFDLEVSSFNEVASEPIWHGNHEIGTLHEFHAETNGTNPRNAYFHEIYDRFNIASDVAASDRAALTTEIDGYPFARAEKLGTRGISTLQIGTEYSGAIEHRLVSPGYIQSLGKAALASLDMSVMKTAMEEELIAEQIYKTVLGFRPSEVVIGDSQAGITAPARITYAQKLHQADTDAVDLRALCCYEKTSLARAAFWLSKELFEGSTMLGEMIINGETERLSKTLSTNPRLQIGATLGKIPVLLGGELASTIGLIDRDIPGQVLRYNGDGMSPENGMAYWNDFTNINQRTTDGNHLSLGRSRGNDSQVDRIVRMIETKNARGSLKNLSVDEANYIYRHGSLTYESDRPAPGMAA